MKITAIIVACCCFAAALTNAGAAEPKKVLVVTTTLGFRHSSIPTAEKVLQQLADESKAFTIVDFARQPTVAVPRKPNAPKKPAALKPDASDADKAKYEKEMTKFRADEVKHKADLEKYMANETANKAAQAEFDAAMKKSLEKLSPENLKKYDGVIFANTTGDLTLPDREAFIDWIKAGHAFIGMHSCGDTFHGFPRFLEMLGAEFRGHGAQVPADLHVIDQNHPATTGLPSVWNIQQEEMYQFRNYDPTKVHDLCSMNHHPNNPTEAGLFPVAWCKKFGDGKVFYTSLGHREDIWDADPNMPNRKNTPEIAKQYQQHILGGIKWALGLAPGDATPQAK